MKVGTQHGNTEEILKACAAFGVDNICSSLPSEKMDDKLIDFRYRAVRETDVQSRAVVRAFYGREP